MQTLNKLQAITYITNSNADYFDVKEVKITRSNAQNRAMHLWFKQISQEFIDRGQTFFIPNTDIEVTPTEGYIKEIAKLIIKALFGHDSTTKLDTKELNLLIDQITLFTTKYGFSVAFPSEFGRFVDGLM